MHQDGGVAEGGSYTLRRRRRDRASRYVRNVERRVRTTPVPTTRWPDSAPSSAAVPHRDDGIERLPMGTGSYELVYRLGGGGMAEVFLSRHVGLHGIEHHVVIKRLRDDVRSLPSVISMFTWEAWISARLCHPHIVTFHDYVSYRGRDHLVLEHVRGPDLATMIRTLRNAGRVFPLRAVVDIGLAISRALAHVHALADDDGRSIGLVHRDVSPQNILVSVDGQIKLIDFGVAKTTSKHVPRETEPTLVKGKMGYIAPEHIRGQALDARSDIYALGVVLFEMLTGTPLLRRCDDMEMIRAALLSDVPLIATLRPDCPPSLDALVHRALARNPEDRFENAEAMEKALLDVSAWLGGEVGAPTLRDVARCVYSSPDPRQVLEALPNLPELSTSALDPHEPRLPNALDPPTRPEGPSCTTDSDAPPDSVNPFVEAAIGTANASLVVARSMSSIRREPNRAWMTRTVPLTLAFVAGVILAGAIFEAVRKKAAIPVEPTHGSAAHGAP